MAALRLMSACAALRLTAGANDQCTNAQGVKAPCGPGNDQCNAASPFSPAPQFHVQDLSCQENDPNGPCFDPAHNVYHLFYQDHLAITGGNGPVWGHVVSRDLVHWARMPVAIWNDQPYDSQAIFSGSCAAIDGHMKIVYPGVCHPGSAQCETGTTIALASPANASDPLAAVWEKAAFNPVAHINASVGPGGGGPAGGGGDPSAPWQTPSGEWRIATRDNVTQVIWATMDLESPEWYWVGPQPNFPQGACPSFFPLPKHTPGASAAPAGAEDPTHVYLWSDTVYTPGAGAAPAGSGVTHRVAAMVGTYTDTGVRAVHSFEATPGVAKSLELQIADNGSYYAAKDFYDPVKDRRILWGWAQIDHGAQSMPREVTWHPQLQQLVFSPLEEQARLRTSPALTSLSDVKLRAGEQQRLGDDWSPGVGCHSEVAATFTMPEKATRFGIGMLIDQARKCPLYEAWVQFSPAGDMETGVGGSWLVEVGVGGAVQSLGLLPSDETIDIRVFTDNVLAEVYFMNGRVALTTPVMATEACGFTVFTSEDLSVQHINAWQVSSIWVTPDEVIKTPPAQRLEELVV